MILKKHNVPMKRILWSVAVLGCLVSQLRAEDQATFTDKKQKFSYSLGMNFGTSWKSQEIDVDLDTLVKGIKDAMAGKTALTQEQARETLMEFSKEMRAKQEEKRKLLGEKNKKEGAEFLAANKNKSGVITLPSGLQYKVITDGTGPIPKSNDTVSVNYVGTLIDGTEFDSSIKRGQPASFPVTRVIKGWTEALEMMKVGSKWELFIPSDLAYGTNGSGSKIAPNATLIFNVDLLSIQPPAQPVQPAATVAPATSAPVTSDIIKVPSAEEMKKGAKIEVIKKEDLEKQKK
jgi:FKBP-type peptidyl-prolyl cis-trans isomerase FklB